MNLLHLLNDAAVQLLYVLQKIFIGMNKMSWRHFVSTILNICYVECNMIDASAQCLREYDYIIIMHITKSDCIKSLVPWPYENRALCMDYSH